VTIRSGVPKTIKPAKTARAAKTAAHPPAAATCPTPNHANMSVEAKPSGRKGTPIPTPTHHLPGTDTLGEASVYVGDCREVLAALPAVVNRELDLVFADPPFNWNRDYHRWEQSDKASRVWDDAIPREDYLAFTREWLSLCAGGLKDSGSMWVNIPDDTAAEIVVYLKSIGLTMVNWCIWHYRFGQNRQNSFINSKVHALYFCKDPKQRTWNPAPILEPSDRATTYFDPRTLDKKDGMPAGMRVPMDVWYGQYWGRIQGNNAERRPAHDNQLPEIYLERVIRCSSNAGDLVLDPFVGSGTTGVMARALNRRFVGTEFSPDNARGAFERLGLGPARPLGDGLNAATNIFAARKASDKAKRRMSSQTTGANLYGK